MPLHRIIKLKNKIAFCITFLIIGCSSGHDNLGKENNSEIKNTEYYSLNASTPSNDECQNVHIVADAIMQIRLQGAELEDVLKSAKSTKTENTRQIMTELAHDAYRIDIPATAEEKDQLQVNFANKWKEDCLKKAKS